MSREGDLPNKPRTKRLRDVVHAATRKFEPNAWMLWKIPKTQQWDATYWELGRELLAGTFPGVPRRLRSPLLTLLLDYRGKPWLDLDQEQRSNISRQLADAREQDRVLKELEDGSRYRMPAVLIPEALSADDLKRLIECRDDMTEYIWLSGDPSRLSPTARPFRIAVDFTLGMDAVLSALGCALKAPR